MGKDGVRAKMEGGSVSAGRDRISTAGVGDELLGSGAGDFDSGDALRNDFEVSSGNITPSIPLPVLGEVAADIATGFSGSSSRGVGGMVIAGCTT